MNKILTSLGILLVATGAVAATYTVKSGDTMKKIAEANGISFATLREMNPQVTNPNLIYPGQNLNLGGERIVIVEEGVEPVEYTKPCEACDNVINGNPLYRPQAGHFYSVTSIETDTSFDPWSLNEVFGFGISDTLSIWLDTTASTYKFDGDYPWSKFGGGLSARLIDVEGWKGDVYGKLMVIGGEDWWHEDFNAYQWTAGAKFGWSECMWTLNALFEYNYTNSEAFNWDEKSYLRGYRAGIEGQLVLTSFLNVVANVVYEMPEWLDNSFSGMIGLNYNFADDGYVGIYAKQGLKQGHLPEGVDRWNDETTLGIQLGFDF